MHFAFSVIRTLKFLVGKQMAFRDTVTQCYYGQVENAESGKEWARE